MAQWVRFSHQERVGFGTLKNNMITAYSGDMFGDPKATGDEIALEKVEILIPCVPSKIIGLWNNSRSLAEKQGLSKPDHPLYFHKGANTHLATGQVILKPENYDGRVIFEAELGIVIGKECANVAVENASDYIFGYTCINDVTALSLLDADPSFPQWARAKGFDSFGVFGPVIDTIVDVGELRIRAELNGRERQNYLVSDLFYAPSEIVSALSKDMTLMPGDVIACGTGPGALPMKPGSVIDVIIDPIGRLNNSYELSHMAHNRISYL